MEKRNPSANAGGQRDGGSICGLGGPLEEETATHCGILAWRAPRTEEPGGLLSWGHKELDTTEQACVRIPPGANLSPRVIKERH